MSAACEACADEGQATGRPPVAVSCIVVTARTMWSRPDVREASAAHPVPIEPGRQGGRRRAGERRPFMERRATTLEKHLHPLFRCREVNACAKASNLSLRSAVCSDAQTCLVPNDQRSQESLTPGVPSDLPSLSYVVVMRLTPHPCSWTPTRTQKRTRVVRMMKDRLVLQELSSLHCGDQVDVWFCYA